MRRAAFTGTQTGMSRMQTLAFTREIMIYSPHEFRHGMCVGSDTQAHRIVRNVIPDLHIKGHPPLNTRKMTDLKCDSRAEPKDYLPRNRDIVDESDHLFATPEGPEKLRSGTWSTIRYARKRGMPVTIIWPDGRVERMLDKESVEGA